MYNHHLKRMTEVLANAGLLDKKANALKVLMDYWDDKIALIWSTEDVISRAKEKGQTISEEEARDILQSVLQHHDCTIGITWDTIDSYL